MSPSACYEVKLTIPASPVRVSGQPLAAKTCGLVRTLFPALVLRLSISRGPLGTSTSKRCTLRYAALKSPALEMMTWQLYMRSGSGAVSCTDDRCILAVTSWCHPFPAVSQRACKMQRCRMLVHAHRSSHSEFLRQSQDENVSVRHPCSCHLTDFIEIYQAVRVSAQS